MNAIAKTWTTSLLNTTERVCIAGLFNIARSAKAYCNSFDVTRADKTVDAAAIVFGCLGAARALHGLKQCALDPENNKLNGWIALRVCIESNERVQFWSIVRLYVRCSMRNDTELTPYKGMRRAINYAVEEFARFQRSLYTNNS